MTSRTFIGLALCVAFAGCATTTRHDGLDIDETLALGVAESFTNHLIARNFNGAMALLSDDFSDPVLKDKQGFGDYLTTANERGYFERAVLKSFPAGVEIHRRSAAVYPIEIQAELGVVVYSLTLRAERMGWMIVGIRTELY